MRHVRSSATERHECHVHPCPHACRALLPQSHPKSLSRRALPPPPHIARTCRHTYHAVRLRHQHKHAPYTHARSFICRDRTCRPQRQLSPALRRPSCRQPQRVQRRTLVQAVALEVLLMHAQRTCKHRLVVLVCECCNGPLGSTPLNGAFARL